MYSKLIIKVLSVVFIVSMFFSCSDESIVLAPRDFGYEYYPVELGNYWIYQMDSVVVLNGGQETIPSTSFLKEELTDLFINEIGDTAYVLTISKSDDLNGNFNVTDRYRLEATGSRLTRFEENLGFIKLFFPIEEGVEIDANLFDHLIKVNVAQQEMQPFKEWMFKVKDNRLDTTINNVAYDNLAKIQQADHENDLEIRKSTEFYAPDIGLVRREQTILDDQCGTACLNQEWIDRADRGYTLIQQLVEHN